jgi:hypothetical protein
LIIRPTDKEVGEDICIAAAGYGLESIARDETATIAEPASVDSLLRGSRDSRQIEDNTGWLGICFQDLGHQRAVATTNIDHHGELPKIVGFDGGAMPCGESDLAAGFDPSAVQRGRDPSQRAMAAAWAYLGLASITSMEPRVGITAVSSNPAVASRS